MLPIFNALGSFLFSMMMRKPLFQTVRRGGGVVGTGGAGSGAGVIAAGGTGEGRASRALRFGSAAESRSWLLCRSGVKSRSWLRGMEGGGEGSPAARSGEGSRS